MSPAITREEAFDRTMRCNAGHEYRLASWDCPDPSHDEQRVASLENDLRLVRADLSRLLTSIQTAEAVERERNARTRRFLDEVAQGPFLCVDCDRPLWSVAITLDPGTEVLVDDELFEHLPDCTRGDWS